MKIFEPGQYQSQFSDRPACRRRRAGVFAALAASVFVSASVICLPSASFAAKGDCSQPLTNEILPLVSDCLYILKSAVGTVSCAFCVCDTNGTASVTASDALMCLKSAVGQSITLKCPACAPVTTTTTTTRPLSSTSSTTTSSTSSTTTTLPVACESNTPCVPLGPPYRCNPFTGTCEKPCNSNNDCQGILECNPSKYCYTPALLY